METQLKGKIAIITGASKGMGKAIALALSVEGAKVCLVARTEATLKETAIYINEKTGNEVMEIAGDVASLDLAERVAQAVVKRWQTIHILVNNAGGPPPGSFLEHSEIFWNQTIQQNLLSVIRFTRNVVPYMKKQSWGRIINITSTLAKEPTPPMVLSATARAGVSAFSKAVSGELAPSNITINTICPGGVLTDRLRYLFEASAQREKKSFEDILNRARESIPMQRFADPREIASVAVFLASEPSSYLTGTSIAVDGALTKSIF